MYKTCPICKSEIEAASESCPACGFNLFGSTQRIQPITFTREEAQAFEKPKPQDARFVIVRGEHVNTAHALENRVMSIGRAPKNDIFLNDMTVSSIHAEVFPRGENYVIRDKGSFNGVWINNQNVTEQALKDGDIVQIGTFCLLFEQ